MNQRIYRLLPVTLIICIGVLFGCDEESNTIFDPDKEMDPDPVIQQVVPEEEAYAGIGSVTLEGIEPVTIYGENFGADKDRVYVYFGESTAEILELHNDRIVVIPPDDPGEDRRIRVSIIGSEKYADVDYGLISIFTIFPGLEEADDPFGITTDSEGILYAANEVSDAYDGVDRFFRDGDREKVIEPENWTYKRLVYGPDEAIYLARGGTIPIIYRFVPGSGEETPEILLGPAPAQGGSRVAVEDFDFDQNGYIWAGGRNHDSPQAVIMRVDVQNDGVEVEEFSFDADIHAIRVYQDHLYVGAQDYPEEDGDEPNISGVWRFAIDGDNQLGEPELFAELDDPEDIVHDIAFTRPGNMVLATSTAESVLIHRNQNLEPLYPGVIPPGATNFAVSSKNPEQLVIGIRETEVEGRSSETKIILLEMATDMVPSYGSM